MQARALLIGITVALVAASTAATSTHATPTRYSFSFRVVASKPDYSTGFPAVRVSGSGSGSFSIRHRQIDRDGTVFWDLVNAQGSMTLSQGGRPLVRAVIVGGRFGIENATGGLERHVLLALRLTQGRFHCASAAAQIGLQDLPQKHGNLDGMQFHACTTDLQWTGETPALIVHVTPT